MQFSEKYIAMLGEFERLFDFFNARLFDGKLTKPIITSVYSKGRSATLGWFTPRLAWQDKDGNGAPEINISAQYNFRPFEEVAATMLHEMCHLYSYQNGISDTNRSGVRHNRQFKFVCESHGLNCEFMSEYRGFAKTSLKDETKTLLKEYSPIAEILAKDSKPLDSTTEPPASRKKRETYLYVCPECGEKIRSYHPMSLICGNCEVAMEIKTQKEK